jgi:endonuclease YncB( thermonuclease family)
MVFFRVNHPKPTKRKDGGRGNTRFELQRDSKTYLLQPRNILVIFSIVSLTIFGGCSRETSGSLSGTVVRVADGDTITILDAQRVQDRVRLQGIDAPERKQAFSEISRQNLARLVFGKELSIEYTKLDQYGRIVGKLLVDGEDICLDQIRAGLAWHYKEYEKEQSPADRQLYANAEQEARSQKLGLWQDSDPTPPWNFRHKPGLSKESDSEVEPRRADYPPIKPAAPGNLISTTLFPGK